MARVTITVESDDERPDSVTTFTFDTDEFAHEFADRLIGAAESVAQTLEGEFREIEEQQHGEVRASAEEAGAVAPVDESGATRRLDS